MSIFHEKENVKLIGKGRIVLNDVGMAHSFGGFQLNKQLIMHIIFFYYGFEYFFHRKQTSRFDMPLLHT